MATDVTVQNPSLTGIAPGPINADATGNTFSPLGSGTHFIRAINGSGSPITMTIDDPNTVGPDGATAFNPDAAITIPAGATRQVKIASIARFQNPTTGKVTLAWSSATTVTFELFA
jgi:hypothetical protein